MDNPTRDAEIALGYLQGKSAARLGRDFKLSVPQIRRILAAQKVTRGEPISESENQRIVDTMHAKIGQRLYAYRWKRELEPGIVADLMGWSVKKLRSVEKGHSVLTLIDLAEVAQYMGTQMSDLTKGLE